MARYAIRDAGVAVQGFDQLQRALRRIEGGIAPELRVKLKAIGEHVKEVAEGNVSHKSGERHGDDSQPKLEDSVKVSATLKSASIYSTAVHGGAINVGAWTTTGRGPHISRGTAQHWMDRAVRSEESFVEREVNALLDWLLTTFEE